jgi:hypothetical protein
MVTIRQFGNTGFNLKISRQEQDDFFSSFFRRGKNVEFSTDKINVNVLKIPENIGMVGDF